MIRSAVATLTLWYLGLIMILSIGFSVILYHISSDEINRSLRRQGAYISISLLPREFSTIQEFRAGQLAEEQGRLKQNLLMFNIATLLAGGAASYLLARRTLAPIEESIERQSRFTADASHELRTPLTAMQTEIEVALRNNSLSTDEARQLLQSNLEEVAKLRALSDGLLKLAQQEDKDFSKEIIDLAKVVKESHKRLVRAAKQKNIIIEISTTSAKVKGDFESLVELVVILLDNAIKYSPTGSKIEITETSHGKTALVSIRDYGVGIEPSDITHIFDRFYRAETSRSKLQSEGYGLGLSIAKKIAELHSGVIDVKSSIEKGSTFVLKLPLTSPPSF